MKTLIAVLLALVPTVAAAQVQYDQYGNAYPASQPQAYPVDSQPAEQYQYGFVGPHPEPYDYGNAPCYQPGAHFHPYPPFDQYLFRESGGYFYFVGDLGDFGYSGQLYGYQGNHPIPPELGGGFCYIDWQHRHHFPAPPSLPFRYIGGYYSYYGPWDPAYYTYRNAWTGYYNGYYRNSYYGGRYWSVRPPHVYRPSYGWGARGVYRPGVTVVGPGGGRIIVGPGHRPGYAPAPVYAPRPGYVGPPPSRPGYVGPPPSRPGYVGPPPSRPGYVAPAPQRPNAPQPSLPMPAQQRRPGAPGTFVPPPR